MNWALDVLENLWSIRRIADPRWFARGYEQATIRVEVDELEDLHPYYGIEGWHAKGDVVTDPAGMIWGPDAAERVRDHAFGLLVLADLVEHESERTKA